MSTKKNVSRKVESNISKSKIDSPVSKKRCTKKVTSSASITKSSLRSFFTPKAKPVEAPLNLEDSELTVEVTKLIQENKRPGAASIEEDIGIKKLMDHVNNRNEWMKKFNQGKKAHPFFAQAKAQAEAQVHKKAEPFKRENKIMKPVEAPFPGPMFYASAIKYASSSSETSESVRSNSYACSPKHSSFIWHKKKQLLPSPLSISFSQDTFLFPSCTLFWFSLFGKLSSEQTEFSSIDFESKSFRDFFPLSLTDPEAEIPDSPGNWIKRYSATSSRQFLGNQEQLTEIRKWLEKWKLIACESNNDSDDEILFSIPSDDDSDYSSSKKRNKGKVPKQPLGGKQKKRKSKNRVAPITFIHGPSGVGKTSAVYACARDCGFRVLEINASVARSSADIVKLVGELATSHLINSRSNFFQVRRQEPSSKKPPPNLLILIDEVDILFQGERSLFTALSQLAAETRRPFVLTSSRASCSDISRGLIYNIFNFNPAPISNVVTFLQMMCLQEGSVLSQQLSYSLVEYFKGDIRKLILELEVISRSEIKKENTEHQSSLETVKRLFPDISLDSSLICDINIASIDATTCLKLIDIPSYLKNKHPDINTIEKEIDICGISEEMDLEAHISTLDLFTWFDETESSLIEREELESPEICLNAPRVLDVDELEFTKFDFKPHQCPNRLLDNINEFALKPSNYDTLSVIVHEIKQLYHSEILRIASKSTFFSSELLEIHSNLTTPKSLLTKAIAHIHPKSLVMSESFYVLVPHLATQLQIESRQNSRLRSRRVMTSSRFQKANSNHLETIRSAGLFSESIINELCQPDPSNHSLDQSDDSSEAFMSS